MKLQYISDNKGKTTGVFIPIQEWEDLKSRYKGLGDEVIDIPDWHKKIVSERLSNYEKNPTIAEDFNESMDDLEQSL